MPPKKEAKKRTQKCGRKNCAKTKVLIFVNLEYIMNLQLCKFLCIYIITNSFFLISNIHLMLNCITCRHNRKSFVKKKELLKKEFELYCYSFRI